MVHHEKVLTYLNWTAIGLLVLFLSLAVAELFDPRKGGDAIGKGMGWLFVAIAAVMLVLLLLVNLLPISWGKYAGLAVILLPFALVWLDGFWIGIKKYRSYDAATYDGSQYFPDPQRKAIARAITFDKVDELAKLLQEPVPLLNDFGNADHITLLDYAARSYSPYNVKYNKDWATTRRKLELLIAVGATINSDNALRKPAHAQAIDRYPASMLQFFLERGADPNVKGNQALSLLFYVIWFCDESPEKTRLLLDHGAPVDRTDTFDAQTKAYTPLLFAAHLERWDVCALLLKHGADRRYRAPNNMTLMAYLTTTEATYQATRTAPPAEFATVQRLAARLPY